MLQINRMKYQSIDGIYYQRKKISLLKELRSNIQLNAKEKFSFSAHGEDWQSPFFLAFTKLGQ